jgi:hypothetical protein
MACKLHGAAAACIPCARVALRIQLSKMTPCGMRTSSTDFKGRPSRQARAEAGLK